MILANHQTLPKRNKVTNLNLKATDNKQDSKTKAIPNEICRPTLLWIPPTRQIPFVPTRKSQPPSDPNAEEKVDPLVETHNITSQQDWDERRAHEKSNPQNEDGLMGKKNILKWDDAFKSRVHQILGGRAGIQACFDSEITETFIENQWFHYDQIFKYQAAESVQSFSVWLIIYRAELNNAGIEEWETKVENLRKSLSHIVEDLDIYIHLICEGPNDGLKQLKPWAFPLAHCHAMVLTATKHEYLPSLEQRFKSDLKESYLRAIKNTCLLYECNVSLRNCIWLFGFHDYSTKVFTLSSPQEFILSKPSMPNEPQAKHFSKFIITPIEIAREYSKQIFRDFSKDKNETLYSFLNRESSETRTNRNLRFFDTYFDTSMPFNITSFEEKIFSKFPTFYDYYLKFQKEYCAFIILSILDNTLDNKISFIDRLKNFSNSQYKPLRKPGFWTDDDIKNYKHLINNKSWNDKVLFTFFPFIRKPKKLIFKKLFKIRSVGENDFLSFILESLHMSQSKRFFSKWLEMPEQSWEKIQKENIFNNYRDEWIRFNQSDLVLDKHSFGEAFNTGLKKLIDTIKIPIETIEEINYLTDRFILFFIKELNTYTKFSKEKTPVNSYSQTPSWLLPFPHRNFGRKLSFTIKQNTENEPAEQSVNEFNHTQDKAQSLKLDTFGPYSIEELLNLDEE